MMGDTLVLVTGEGYAYTAELRRDETFLWPEVYYFGLELAPLGEDPLPIPLSRGGSGTGMSRPFFSASTPRRGPPGRR